MTAIAVPLRGWTLPPLVCEGLTHLLPHVLVCSITRSPSALLTLMVTLSLTPPDPCCCCVGFQCILGVLSARRGAPSRNLLFGLFPVGLGFHPCSLLLPLCACGRTLGWFPVYCAAVNTHHFSCTPRAALRCSHQMAKGCFLTVSRWFCNRPHF